MVLTRGQYGKGHCIPKAQRCHHIASLQGLHYNSTGKRRGENVVLPIVPHWTANVLGWPIVCRGHKGHLRYHSIVLLASNHHLEFSPRFVMRKLDVPARQRPRGGEIEWRASG